MAENPLILLPTYNERDNIIGLLAAICAVQPRAKILVIDDDSPDGTGALVQEFAHKHKNVHLLRCLYKQGLASAYRAGFAWGFEQAEGFSHFVTMDADFSHDPKYLGVLLDTCTEAVELVIGSRYISGGGTVGWSLWRQWLSRGGGYYARAMLGLPISDPTSGYRCYSRAVVGRLLAKPWCARGYGFQIELLHYALRQGVLMREVPILFTERVHGRSKMVPRIAGEALYLVWQLRKTENIAESTGS